MALGFKLPSCLAKILLAEVPGTRARTVTLDVSNVWNDARCKIDFTWLKGEKEGGSSDSVKSNHFLCSWYSGVAEKEGEDSEERWGMGTSVRKKWKCLTL